MITRKRCAPVLKDPSKSSIGQVRFNDILGKIGRPRPASAAFSRKDSGGAIVTFEPGARTAWHTHPLGQTLIVAAGCGLVQKEDGSIEEIRSGDIVWFAPGEKHWHGAAPTTAMTHIAIAEALDGVGGELDGEGQRCSISGAASDWTMNVVTPVTDPMEIKNAET